MQAFKNLSFVLLLISQIDAQTSERPIVQTSQGKLEGMEKIARNGRPYSAFLGIPFGKTERFEDSVPYDPWTGIKDASKFGAVCLQKSVFNGEIEGEENCLFLNVYTPKASNKTQFPVMVWIHGGAFQFGSGQFGGGKYFMSEDVVLVMINYRLGPFGFLNTGHTANVGMKDQILALKWVKQNIHNFGGDPNSVTIFGESAGGASVGLLIVSPLARGKGLFHRAISQSGTANIEFIFVTDPLREVRKLAVLMDCPISNQEYMIQCIKKIDGKYMLKRLADAAKLPEFKPSDMPRFSLSVNTNVNESTDPFLPDTPTNLLLHGKFEHVPWITGVNEAEGIYYPGRNDLQNGSQKEWNAKIAQPLLFDEYDCKGLGAIRDFYIGNKTNEPKVLDENIMNLFSDRWFIHPAKISAILHAKHAKTYLYYFSKKSPSTIVPNLNPPDSNGLRRAAHVDELQYLFEYGMIYPEIPIGNSLAPFSEFMVKLWTGFAKDGTVSPETISTDARQWRSVSAKAGPNQAIEWYQLDNKSRMVNESTILGERMNFWNDLFQINYE